MTGTYDDMPSARRAVDALQYAGIEAGHISLAGEGAEEAVRLLNASSNTSANDRPILSRVFWRGFWWSVVGALAGAALGLLFNSWTLGFVEGAGSPAIQIATWAMFGHVAGALWGCYAAITSGEAWGLTFQPVVGGALRISVRSADPRDLARAERVFREKQAVAVSRSGP